MEQRRHEFGMLCAVIANSNPFGGGKAKGPLDFYPDERRQTQRQSAEEQESLLRSFFSRFKKKT
jgi:predicted small lipoprotein YifL